MHVLIVEDDIVMQELLATLVRGLNSLIHIHHAETLNTGLALWQKHPIDLVLCDWNLPEQETGLSLVKVIRARDRELPIIMVTGRVDRATVTDSARYKVNEFIVKPFDAKAVMARLKPYLTQSQENTDHSQVLSAGLDEFIGDTEQMLSRITLMPGAEAAANAITHDEPPSAAELAQQWRSDTTITTRLIRLANTTLMRRSGSSVMTLREAIAAIGVDMALTQVLAISLAQTNHLRDGTLQARAKHFVDESLQLAERAARLAQRLKLNIANCYTAGLMVKLGEFGVLEAIQLFIDSGGQVSEGDIDTMLTKHAATYGNQLKIKWRLPLALRERVGATYVTGTGNVNPELLLMRLAACLGDSDGQNQEQDKLCRQLGLSADELPN